MRAAGLYVHIPFCHVKCRFCDFAAYPGLLKEIPRYLKALELEMKTQRGREVDTLFIGGGTPTVLEAAQLRDLMTALRSHFLLEDSLEASVECNPESTTAEKLEAMKQSGVNRLSFGLQAVQDAHLRALGRLHDFAQFEKVFRQARSIGYPNLNIDLMYGLPGQTLADWEETIGRVLELSPEHISAYALSVEEFTAFGRSGVDTDGDNQAEMYETIADRLEAAGYHHYEISNFARPGLECRHNLKYWRNEPCLGIGVSAAGYEPPFRRTNADRVAAYLEAVESGRSPAVETTALTEPSLVGEDLMLALRLKEGLTPTARMRELYGGVLDRYERLGFLSMESGRVRPTRRGWLLSNQIFQELLEPLEVPQC